MTENYAGWAFTMPALGEYKELTIYAFSCHVSGNLINRSNL